MNEELKEEPKLTTDPDLLVDFQGVSFVRDGKTLVGPVDWQVELDERWVVVGPNGAGKTTLIRMAAAQEFPSEGWRSWSVNSWGGPTCATYAQQLG